MPTNTFLSCDWGTSHFRLRLVERDTLCVLDEIKTDQGVGSIARGVAPEQRQARLAEIFTDRAMEIIGRSNASPETCIISGMASSNIGWYQLPYVKAPIRLEPAALGTYSFTSLLTDGRTLQIILVSGVCTGDDIMRGEETELLGLLGSMPELQTASAIVVLPGTHSKHARLERGVLTGFTTYMTGELYANLRDMPTLKASLAGTAPFDESEFLAGVDCVAKAGLMSAFFKTRTRFVLDPQAKPSSPSFLSGLLIGAELADIEQAEGQDTLVCCSAALIRPYSLAAKRLGASLRFVSSEIISKALILAHSRILKPSTQA